MPLLTTIFGLLFSSQALYAGDSFNDKCPDIPTCAKVVGSLLGQKYLYDQDVMGKVTATPNTDLTAENAEVLFTAMLDIAGFSRVPAGQPNTYLIRRQRDARDLPIPSVSADQKTPPELPNNWDLYTLKYKASFPESVEPIARASRSFMPANSRIIPVELSGYLLITDTAMNLKKLYGFVRDMDRKPTAEQKKRWDDEAKERRAEMMQRKHDDAPPTAPAATDRSGKKS